LCPNVYPLSFFDIWKEGPFSKNYKIFSSIYLKPFIHRMCEKVFKTTKQRQPL